MTSQNGERADPGLQPSSRKYLPVDSLHRSTGGGEMKEGSV